MLSRVSNFNMLSTALTTIVMDRNQENSKDNLWAMFWWLKNPWDLVQQLWTKQMLQTVSIHSPLAHSSNNKLEMGKIHFISACTWTSKHQRQGLEISWSVLIELQNIIGFIMKLLANEAQYIVWRWAVFKCIQKWKKQQSWFTLLLSQIDLHDMTSWIIWEKMLHFYSIGLTKLLNIYDVLGFV